MSPLTKLTMKYCGLIFIGLVAVAFWVTLFMAPYFGLPIAVKFANALLVDGIMVTGMFISTLTLEMSLRSKLISIGIILLFSGACALSALFFPPLMFALSAVPLIATCTTPVGIGLMNAKNAYDVEIAQANNDEVAHQVNPMHDPLLPSVLIPNAHHDNRGEVASDMITAKSATASQTQLLQAHGSPVFGAQLIASANTATLNVDINSLGSAPAQQQLNR